MKKIGLLFIFFCLFFAVFNLNANAQSGLYIEPGTSSINSPKAGQTWLFNSTNYTINAYTQNGWVQVSPSPNNFLANTNPSSSNDTTQGYLAGSLWLNTTTNQMFICDSNATGAAIWSSLSNNVNSINLSAPLVGSINNNTLNIGLGTVPPTQGGTGLTSLPLNQVLIGNGTNPITTNPISSIATVGATIGLPSSLFSSGISLGIGTNSNVNITLASQQPNQIFASPVNANGVPYFRQIEPSDFDSTNSTTNGSYLSYNSSTSSFTWLQPITYSAGAGISLSGGIISLNGLSSYGTAGQYLGTSGSALEFITPPTMASVVAGSGIDVSNSGSVYTVSLPNVSIANGGTGLNSTGSLGQYLGVTAAGTLGYITPPTLPTLTAGSGITISGSPDYTIGLTSPVPVSLGGTGNTTLSSGLPLFGNGTSAIIARAIAATDLASSPVANAVLQYSGTALAWTTLAPSTTITTASPFTSNTNASGDVTIALSGLGALSSSVANQQITVNSSGSGLQYSPLRTLPSVTAGAGISVSASGVDYTVALSSPVSVANGGLGVNASTSSGALSFASGVASIGTLPYGDGGTGLSSLGTAGQYLGVNSTASGLAYITPPTMASVVAGTGISVSPSGSAYTVNLSTPVSVANGGTGQSSLSAAINALAIANGAATSGQFLGYNGTNWLPASLPANFITSVTSPLSVSSGDLSLGVVPTSLGGFGQSMASAVGVPTFSSGTLSLNSSLPISLGGTGGTTGQAAINNILGTTTAGNLLEFNGTNWVAAPPSSGGVASINATAPLQANGVSGSAQSGAVVMSLPDQVFGGQQRGNYTVSSTANTYWSNSSPGTGIPYPLNFNTLTLDSKGTSGSCILFIDSGCRINCNELYIPPGNTNFILINAPSYNPIGAGSNGIQDPDSGIYVAPGGGGGGGAGGAGQIFYSSTSFTGSYLSQGGQPVPLNSIGGGSPGMLAISSGGTAPLPNSYQGGGRITFVVNNFNNLGTTYAFGINLNPLGNPNQDSLVDNYLPNGCAIGGGGMFFLYVNTFAAGSNVNFLNVSCYPWSTPPVGTSTYPTGGAGGGGIFCIWYNVNNSGNSIIPGGVSAGNTGTPATPPTGYTSIAPTAASAGYSIITGGVTITEPLISATQDKSGWIHLLAAKYNTHYLEFKKPKEPLEVVCSFECNQDTTNPLCFYETRNAILTGNVIQGGTICDSVSDNSHS